MYTSNSTVIGVERISAQDLNGACMCWMLGADVSESILCLHEVDAGSATVNQLLDKEVSQNHGF